MNAQPKRRRVTGKKPPQAASLNFNNKHLLLWVLFGIVMILVWYIRLRLIDIPLERDEGDYAYHGQLLLDGHSLHDDLVRKRYPMIFIIYSIILTLFGQTATGIHLGLLVVNSLSLGLIYILGKRLGGVQAGIVSAIALALFTLSPYNDAFAANREHFVIPFILGAFILLFKAFDTKKLLHFFLSGLLLGFAYITKEVSIAFVLLAGSYTIYRHFSSGRPDWLNLLKRGSIMALGTLTPISLVFLFFIAGGTFDQFWFRNFVIKKKYASTVNWTTGKTLLLARIKQIVPPISIMWIIAASGLLVIPWIKKQRNISVFMVGMLLFSALAVMPGYYFRPHYFLVFLPAAALLCGFGFQAIQSVLKQKIKPGVIQIGLTLVLLVAIIQPLISNQKDYFDRSPTEYIRNRYGHNPFIEAVEIGKYIKANTKPDDRIIVFGSEPEIYFYANRKSSIEAIYMYDLMMLNEYASEIQDQTIAEASANIPEMCVFVSLDISWLRRDESDNKIFTWLNKEYWKNFYVAGVIDMFEHESKYIFGPEAQSYSPKSKFYILIFKKLSQS